MENLNINELSGWTNQTDINNRKSFIHVFGREPRDVQEIDAWISDLLAECQLKPIRTEDEHTVIDGKECITRRFHYE